MTESKTVSAPYLVSMHASASQKHNIASTKCRGSVTWRRNLQETKLVLVVPMLKAVRPSLLYKNHQPTMSL